MRRGSRQSCFSSLRASHATVIAGSHSRDVERACVRGAFGMPA